MRGIGSGRKVLRARHVGPGLWALELVLMWTSIEQTGSATWLRHSHWAIASLTLGHDDKNGTQDGK